MKLREIFRFEFVHQIRRPWPWLAFALLLVFAFENTRAGIVPVTLPQDFILNSPFIIASVSVFSCLVWLLVASPLAGEAGARDVQTGMHPLIYTSPVRKAEYLGGRFLAAFALNALVLLGVQAGSLLAIYAGGVDPAIIGPFRPAAYVLAYTLIALPNAFIATTMQFTAALLTGRSLASYFGSVLLVFFTFPVPLIIYFALGQPEVAKLLDPIGMIAIMNEMMNDWTLVEKNVRLFTLEGAMLWNRVLWLGIALLTLGFVYLRFRFAHRVTTGLWSRFARATPTPAAPVQIAISVPQPQRSFGSATRLRQMLATAASSFRMIARRPAGLFLLVVFPLFLMLVLRVESEQWGVPLLPRTGYLLTKHVTAALTFATDYRVIVPLLIIYFAGELVWRERDAGLSESVDATAVPEWVLFAGKFVGLSLILVALMAIVTAAGLLVQLLMGYHQFQLALYLKILFGLQLPEYVLFALLAFVIQAVANQKYAGHLAALVAYLFIVLAAPVLGIEHNLLVYGAGPAWSFTDMRGFGPSLAPWLWFKLYWAAWALLLAVAGTLLWVRGRDDALRTRVQTARRRITRASGGMAALALVLIVTLGGFIFYNTNVLNDYRSEAKTIARRAAYERRYGRYEGIPQPQRVATNLHIEIYPDRGVATMRGTYRLVNRDVAPIDSIHIEPASGVETRVAFDRQVRRVLADDDLGHWIYALEQPLQPGDAVTLSFDVRLEPHGFGNTGASTAIVENGSYFTSAALPAIGYQPARELTSPDDRRAQKLPRQVTLPTPDDVDPNLAATSGALFDAVVGTDTGQVAVAPGELRRTWTAGGRRYFHYGSDAPIVGLYVFFSADYAVHQEQWKDVGIQVFLHPAHTANLRRVLRSARASLDYYTTQFGAYPHRFLQIVEQPGNFFGMGVDGSGVVTGGEGFFLLNPQEQGVDVVSEVVAHEVAHLWWGEQLKYAYAEGAILLSESLAWYSAMQVMKEANGPEQLRRLRAFMREPAPWPPIRTGLPLLRAMDPWAGYRKGPFAFYALSEYIGEARVNGALRSLLQQQADSLATTLDLYRELQAVTPDSMQYLLHDLFETNTFWELATEQATARQTAAGSWQVTLDVHARKVVADTAGVETEVPMNEWIEIGVYDSERGRAPMFLKKHRIRSGAQRITVIVPRKPVRAGIDPEVLLIDLNDADNVDAVEIGK